MGNVAVSLDGIGKKYRIGARKQTYKTLRETLMGVVTSPFRRLGQLLRHPMTHSAPPSESIWALKDISFDIKQGEVVGLIGRNGAGKSTLLKILARITEPTTGSAEIRGRIASLLEVGTGFHPELTGRENIYLNGAILGMKRAEIVRNFDEIVAFAEVEKFIDTPVKHYSSGMYLRLAFAVAAHLEPEILLIDEVLAVGDVHFQKKCLAKMEQVGHEGRTVLFVSHNMPAVTRLCPRTILLGRGGVQMDGPSYQVAGKYMNSDVGTSAERTWPEQQKAPGNDIIRLRAVRLRGVDGRLAETVDVREPIAMEMEYDILKPGYMVVPHFAVHNLDNVQLFSAVETDPEWKGRKRPAGRYVTVAWIPGNYLAEGTLIVGAAANTLNPSIMHFYVGDAVAFCVIDSYEGDSARGDLPDELHGVVRPMLNWTTKYSPGENEYVKIHNSYQVVNREGSRLP
jgi:homopolymeric O-antigen transport system ATP-binding protein